MKQRFRGERHGDNKESGSRGEGMMSEEDGQREDEEEVRRKNRGWELLKLTNR